jgi:hypothetical protein
VSHGKHSVVSGHYPSYLSAYSHILRPKPHPGCGKPCVTHDAKRDDYPPDAFTIATMAARIASGSVGQTVTRRASSGSEIPPSSASSLRPALRPAASDSVSCLC